MQVLLPDVGKRIIHIENLRIANIPKNEWNGSILTILKIVHSVLPSPQREGTSIRLIDSGMSPFLRTAVYSVPGNNIAIRNFASMRTKLTAPFKASLVGTVTNVGSLDMTQLGLSKRTFEIVDDQGAWMKALVVGKNATSLSLAEGVQVVLYSINGRPGSSSVDATVMVAKDSVIVPTGRRSEAIKRMYIDLNKD